jgi:hypothetical protein
LATLGVAHKNQTSRSRGGLLDAYEVDSVAHHHQFQGSAATTTADLASRSRQDSMRARFDVCDDVAAAFDGANIVII